MEIVKHLIGSRKEIHLIHFKLFNLVYYDKRDVKFI